MFLMNYMFSLILALVVFGVVSLGITFSPYRGVVVLMAVSFFCCVFMVMLGRTFAALVMYIVYLGGLIVVFGYCVSVEKDKGDGYKVGNYKYFVVFLFTSLVYLLWLFFGGFGGSLIYSYWGDFICLEVNGGSVFYFSGGVGLMVCSWGLLLMLFSVLIVLSWSRLGGLRPF